jgi:hypothetical protein
VVRGAWSKAGRRKKGPIRGEFRFLGLARSSALSANYFGEFLHLVVGLVALVAKHSGSVLHRAADTK